MLASARQCQLTGRYWAVATPIAAPLLLGCRTGPAVASFSATAAVAPTAAAALPAAAALLSLLLFSCLVLQIGRRTTWQVWLAELTAGDVLYM